MKLGSFLWCIFQASNIPFLQKMHIPFSNFHILPIAMLYWSSSCLQFVWYSLLEIINYAISEQGQGQQFHWPAVSQGFMLFISNLLSVWSMFIISNHYYVIMLVLNWSKHCIHFWFMLATPSCIILFFLAVGQLLINCFRLLNNLQELLFHLFIDSHAQHLFELEYFRI